MDKLIMMVAQLTISIYTTPSAHAPETTRPMVVNTSANGFTVLYHSPTHSIKGRTPWAHESLTNGDALPAITPKGRF